MVWNKIQGYLDWLRDDFKSAARDKCSTDCRFSNANRANIKNADAVLFHAKT